MDQVDSLKSSSPTFIWKFTQPLTASSASYGNESDHTFVAIMYRVCGHLSIFFLFTLPIPDLGAFLKLFFTLALLTFRPSLGSFNISNKLSNDINEGSHREVYKEFRPSYDIFRRWCQGLIRPQVPCTLSLHCPIANSSTTQNQQPV